MTDMQRDACRKLLLRLFFSDSESFLLRSDDYAEACSAVGFRPVFTQHTKTMVWKSTGEVIRDPFSDWD